MREINQKELKEYKRIFDMSTMVVLSLKIKTAPVGICEKKKLSNKS